MFTQAYAAAANCAPSRASVYTGQSNPRHGVLTVGGPARGLAEHRRPIPAPNKEHLDPAIPTFPKLLQKGGYRTIHVGKWHIGEDPTKAGFDLNIGGCSWGHPANGYFSPYRMPGFEDGPEGEYLTERLTRDTVKTISTLDPEKPFFMFYANTLPHARHEIDDFGLYKDKPWSERGKAYAGQVTRIDSDVGELLDTLCELGIDKNTLVIFTGDNGSSFPPESEIGKRFNQASNGLRGYKRGLYEGALRQDAIAWWPGTVPAGYVDEQPWAF